MSVVKIDIDRYVGKSTDIKPLDAPIGAVFYEYNTEALYDKTLNCRINNGWKLRDTGSGGGGGTPVNVKVDSTSQGLVGIQNGANVAFTVSEGEYISNSVLVFVSGTPMAKGNGFVETDPANGIITLTKAPASYDVVIVVYSHAGTVVQNNYVDSTNNGLVGAQNGINQVFRVSQSAYNAGSMLFFVSGVPMANGNGFTETTPGSGIITLNFAPSAFDILIANYSN